MLGCMDDEIVMTLKEEVLHWFWFYCVLNDDAIKKLSYYIDNWH